MITSQEKRFVTAAQEDNPEVRDDSQTGATFKIKDCKLHVPVVTLSAENDNKLLHQLKTGSFENENDRVSFSKYHVPKVEIEDFNVLTDGKPFFEIPVKNKEEPYEAIIKMSRNSN